jgi:hypothetical protein
MKTFSSKVGHILCRLWTELCENGWRMELCMFPDDPASEDLTQLVRAPRSDRASRQTSR